VCVCVAKHHAVKEYSVVDVRVYYRVVLTSTLDGNEWSDLLIDRFTLEEIFLM
jgi:hypothetical protein